MLRGHTKYVTSVSWSPDGSRIATASRDGTARVWDAASGAEALTLKGHTGDVSSVSWSPDGRRIATASSDKTARVWDCAGARSPSGCWRTGTSKVGCVESSKTHRIVEDVEIGGTNFPFAPMVLLLLLNSGMEDQSGMRTTWPASPSGSSTLAISSRSWTHWPIVILNWWA